jgi:hypothetical protein
MTQVHSFVTHLLPPKAGLFDARIVQLVQNVVLILHFIHSIARDSLIKTEPLENIIVELGLELCEQIGSIKDAGKRSRISLLVGLLLRYVKAADNLCLTKNEASSRLEFLMGKYAEM